MTYPKLYDTDLKLVAILDKAYAISYSHRLNEVWEASFSMPADDPKAADCQPLRFVELFDGDESIGMYRIMPTEITRQGGTKTLTYTLEHVMGTLIDNTIFRYHQLDNQSIASTLDYLLGFQSPVRWQLGTVDFPQLSGFSFENTNILSALFSVTKVIAQDFQWTFDTSSYPWTLNLIKSPSEVSSRIRYGLNMQSISKTTDYTQLATRIYALGSGEGVNQLGIESVNPTGKPYIDASTIGTYGLFETVLVDKSIENAQTLYDTAKAALEQIKTPPISYATKAADVHIISGNPADKLALGSLVSVYDDELGIDVQTRIMVRGKHDVTGAPGDVDLEIANKVTSIADDISRLADRLNVQQLNAQGATSLDSYQFNANCDPSNPAKIRFFVPAGAVKINMASLSYESHEFEAYSKATKGGGATATTTAAGGGVATTTAAGGGSTQTSSSGGGVSKSTSAGGGTTETSSAGGNHRHEMFSDNGAVPDAAADGIMRNFIALVGPNDTDGAAGAFFGSGGAGNLYTKGASGSHSHSVTLSPHSHSFSTPDHTHNISLPSHTHGITLSPHIHSISLPDHTHALEYGIYKGPTPTALTVKVDGKTVSGAGTSESDLDIVPYLSKDSGGRINRGTWHELEITPNNLGRITANLTLQHFIQSRGEYNV